MSAKLTIVIPSWNTRDVLRDCLASIYQYTDAGFDVIVVDNGSTDGTPALLAREFPQVRIIANERNQGFAAACNQGMAEAHGDYILLLNSDTYVRDNVITRVSAYLDGRLDVAMVGCQLRYPDGRLQYTAFHDLSIWRSLLEDFWLYKLAPARKRARLLLGGYWQADEEIVVDWLAGAFMMLRRDVYRSTGGFATDFFMYGEDTEWCHRIRRAGGKIVFAPIGVVYHLGSVSSDMMGNDANRLALCHQGGLRAYSLAHGPVRARLYHGARLLGAAVRCAAYALITRVRATDYYREQLKQYALLTRIYAWGAD